MTERNDEVAALVSTLRHVYQVSPLTSMSSVEDVLDLALEIELEWTKNMLKRRLNHLSPNDPSLERDRTKLEVITQIQNSSVTPDYGDIREYVLLEIEQSCERPFEGKNS